MTCLNPLSYVLCMALVIVHPVLVIVHPVFVIVRVIFSFKIKALRGT